MTNRTELEDRAMEWVQTMLNSDMEPEFKEIIEDVETEDVSDVEGVYALARHLAFYNEARPVPPQAAGFVLWAFRLAIQEENGEAMLNLGVLYYTGRLGEQDFAKAVKYYKMAYAHGEWFACQNLGYCYYYGRSVEVDYAGVSLFCEDGAQGLYRVAIQAGRYVRQRPVCGTGPAVGLYAVSAGI